MGSTARVHERKEPRYETRNDGAAGQFEEAEEEGADFRCGSHGCGSIAKSPINDLDSSNRYEAVETVCQTTVREDNSSCSNEDSELEKVGMGNLKLFLDCIPQRM